MGIAFYIKLFIHFHASYMEYSRVQCKYANMQSTVLYYFKKIKQIDFILLWKLRTYFEISTWNGSYVKGD